MLWSNWTLTAKRDSRSQRYSRLVLYFVKLLNSRTFPSYQSMSSSSLAQYKDATHQPTWPSYQTCSERTYFTGRSYCKLYPWYPAAALCMYGQEWSLPRWLTPCQLCLHYLAVIIPHSLTTTRQNFFLLSVSSSNMRFELSYSSHQVKCFSLVP